MSVNINFDILLVFRESLAQVKRSGDKPASQMKIYREYRRLKKTVNSKDRFSNSNAVEVPRDAKWNLADIRSQGCGLLMLYKIFQVCILLIWKYLKNNQNKIPGPEAWEESLRTQQHCPPGQRPRFLYWFM